jgi:2-oxoglutarate ferredoxin oxidoreductase subunit beta
VKEWIMTDDRLTFPLNFRDYESDRANDWCAGCGDHGILRALEKALAGLEMPLDEVAVFGGIGCSGKTPYYLNTFGIHTLHGRVLSFATGAKLANPELNVIAVGGDGDALSIGAGHFVNSGRRNLNLTYIMFNNGVYGLTKGQAAPTHRATSRVRQIPSCWHWPLVIPG